MERALGQWIDDQTALLDLEREEEVGQLTDRISSLPAKTCQSEGLSLLNLEVDSYPTVLFGRCCITLQRVDKQQIVQSFKVGDEVSLYNPKLVGNGSKANEDALLSGLVGRIAQYKVEMIVDEYDEHLFDPPLRMDLRSSQKTHATMKSAIASMQHEGMHNSLVNLMFNPDLQHQQIAVPSRTSARLENDHMWNPGLNESQRRAIQCALDTPSVAIIHGPPGTGKTSTLTELILQAVNRDLRILVCAPSNIAVDTILGRLADYSTVVRGVGSGGKGKQSAGRPALKCALNMVRVGHPARISEKILRYALDSIISNDEVSARPYSCSY
jgi:ATP-dependent RNA/DNA helicase IGHMBP2